MNTDDRIAVLEAEITALKFAVIALALRLEAGGHKPYGDAAGPTTEALH